MILIQKIELPVPGIEQMRAEARSQSYNFLETLVEEWQSGENRFDAPGEILCGHLHQGQLIAVGGLNIDPFLPIEDPPQTGRIRRVYVMSAWRNQGIGRALVQALIHESKKGFRQVRLRAENDPAARLYESLGFVPIASPSATHILRFE